jgi:hypothetical protein
VDVPVLKASLSDALASSNKLKNLSISKAGNIVVQVTEPLTAADATTIKAVAGHATGLGVPLDDLNRPTYSTLKFDFLPKSFTPDEILDAFSYHPTWSTVNR